MNKKYKTITLCGSTRFKDDYIRVQKELTLAGNIVISVGLFGHQGDDEVWEDGVKEMLDDMHLAKIDMADEIFVINPGGYIGASTKREIAYASAKGKKISSLEPIPDELTKGKEILQVVLDKETREYVRKVAYDAGCTEDFMIDTVLKDYDRMLNEQ